MVTKTDGAIPLLVVTTPPIQQEETKSITKVEDHAPVTIPSPAERSYATSDNSKWWASSDPARDVHGYAIGTCIGKGSFGSVWLAVRRSEIDVGNPQEFAIKIVPSDKFNEDEYALQKSVAHSTVVEVYEWFTDSGSMYIVLEFLAGGDLFDYVQSYHDQPTDEGIVLMYFQQMLTAVMAVHSQGVIHHDIKLENFLLSRDRTMVKLCDFGSAEVAQDAFALSTRFTGSVFAPEKRACCGPYNGFLADEFQLGKTLYELAFGLTAQPCPALTCSAPLLCDLIIRMCHVDPLSRISLDLIPQHRWMTFANMPELRRLRVAGQHKVDRHIDEAVQTEGSRNRRPKCRKPHRRITEPGEPIPSDQ